MVSDEEILERAFLSALRQHFKKPGHWLPVENFTANAVWKPDAGQVWEIYVRNTAGSSFLLNGGALSGMSPDCWLPALVAPMISNLSGEIGTPGGNNTSLDSSIAISYFTMQSEGWIISENDTITCTVAWMLRKRRRFDLET